MVLPFSCKKHLDAGINTNVTGIVFDSKNQQPIPNVPIYISEYETGFYGPRYKAIIDSSKSSPNGKYAIHFSTPGHGIQYRIGFRPDADFYTLQGAAILNVGKDTTVDFYATKYHILKARLQITENPNPPMRVSTIAGLQANVWGTNNDTVVFMKIIPDHINKIQFTITNIDSPSIYNYQIDTIKFSGFQDTFNLTIPLFPKNFPKRG